jgi:hypothetical protein
MLQAQKISSMDFIEGCETADGISCQWICTADNHLLEQNQDWIHWAFPLWSPADAQALSEQARSNIRLLVNRLDAFLVETVAWKQSDRLLRMPLDQILQSLNLAGLSAEAERIYSTAVHQSHPSEAIRGYWDQALGLAPES